MNEAARKLEGLRVIVQGLGVGVRAGREFLLFDRSDESDAPVPSRPLAEAYPLAVARLNAWGLQPDPALVSHVRVATAMDALPVHHLAFVAADYAAAIQRIVDAGGTVAVRRDDSVLFEAGGVGIEIVRDTDREETFWCPMHPDVRSAEEGTCPVCGMALVPIPPPTIGEYKLDVSQVRRGGRTTGLTLAVRAPGSNEVVTKFSIVHEKPLHLFLVRRDLGYFTHVHPQPDGNRFVLNQAIPPGEYMLIADFLPEGGTLQMVQKAIIVTGEGVAAPLRDESMGLKVTLRVDGVLAAGKQAKLTFTVADAKTGAAVTDLQPYLGAPAHMLIVRSDLGDAIHAHPEEQATSGPTVSFHPMMPAAGDYRMWIQFQRAGQVSTTHFDVAVR